MEQDSRTGNAAGPGEVRRSSRVNKGVPPKRYSEVDKANLSSSMSGIVDYTRVDGEVHSVEAMNLERSLIDNVQRRLTSSEIVPLVTVHATESKRRNKEKSVSSKSSTLSKLNLELRLIQKQKELDERELQEKIISFEKQREYAKKEIEIQKQMAEMKSESDSQSRTDVNEIVECSSQLYGNDTAVNKWLQEAECQIINSQDNRIKCSSEIEHPTSDVHFPTSSGGGEKYDKEYLLLDIARKCISNTNNTNKVLLRQKMRDLTQFSGEFTEWPIFISEYRRSTDQFGLKDEENLTRLDRALKGKARETVKALLISPRNVEKIIKMLEMNFGRPDWIFLSLIDKVKKIGYIKEDKLDSCIFFLNTINNMVTTMKNVNASLYLYNPELLANLVAKLPLIQKYSWGKCKHQRDTQGIQTSLEDFSNWYEDEVNSMAAISNPFHRNSSKNPARRESVMMTRNNDTLVCNFCKKTDHTTEKCQQLLAKTVADRREAVSSLKLCFLCLKSGHMAVRCFLKKRCGTEGCRGRHSNILHLSRNSSEGENEQGIRRNGNPISEQPCTSQSQSPINFCANLMDRRDVLLRIVPVILRGPFNEIKTFALLDEGSTCSMIEEDLAEKLELAGHVVPFCFQWTNEITHHEDDSKMVSLDISADKKHPHFYQLTHVRTVKNLRLPKQDIDVEELSKQFPYLDRKILHGIKSARPELLIGQDNCGLIVTRNLIQPRINQPIMSQSKLGWSVHGPIKESNTIDLSHVNLCCRHVEDEELHQIVKESFRLEDFGVKIQKQKIKSVEDIKAVEIMERTCKKVGERYEIGHLWKNKDLVLPYSKANALKRLYCMERKMDQDPKFAEQYKENIEKYIQKGYAKKMMPSEVPSGPKTWYLPHFSIWNVNKPGKLRMVFDAAAKSSGSSLNDFLFQGPDYVPALISVLWRFRQGKIAIGGDIREMFHQILIREEDRCAQLFLWRGEERNRDPDVYVMNVMIFGAVSSPSIAQFIKNKNASLFETDYPGILRAIEKQHYVDDFLDSCFTVEEAITRVRNVIYVHKQAGYEMVKWMSNSPVVMQSIPEHLRAESQNEVKIDSERLERVLGLTWCPKSDEFVLSLNLKKISSELLNGTKVPTKREVLRVIMSVFDPLCFLAPLMVKARILMQNIWRSDISWDQDITENLYSSWKKWIQDIAEVVPVKIPRYYFPSLERVDKVDLHVFCDASDKAYAAVAYLRTLLKEQVYTSFVTAKFKVAPINQQTIPKLELQGAVLACRIAKTIKDELEYNIEEVHFWTDSLVVIQQIRSATRRFPVFVACRLGEIHEESNESQWHWLPSELNVADQATKELKSIDLKADGMWLNGPDFLKSSIWPEEPKCMEEVKSCLLLSNTQVSLQMQFPDIVRFSKLNRLVRALAWILHFKTIIKIPKQHRPVELNLSAEVQDQAKKLWIRKCQFETFEEEFVLLKQKRSLSKSSRLYKLSVFLDEEELIRLGGRIRGNETMDISYECRNPLVLDSRHRFTELLIEDYHLKSGHVGLETVVNSLRSKYWVLNSRAAVKRAFRKCRICMIKKSKPVCPEMGMLPSKRLEPYTFPFTYVGIDFFGPMTVSIGRRIEKRYGVLFTCLTIRAVHIEIAASLDTSSTILAIRRFMGRRGHPKEFTTDNGTNFVGAERELREYIESLDQNRLADELSIKGVAWKFNPPGAPHMGGIWERMVRSVKTALKFSLKSVNPREEVLNTLLVEAECIINSRPLTHISVDPDEPEAITPNHFLLLRPGEVRPYEETTTLTRKQWRIAEALANSFWRRWIHEYRPNLLKRQKWHDKIDSLKVGDVVIIVDEKAPRNSWLMGRIEETYPGKDGVVRVAKIKTSKGAYVRPVAKLCLLPTSSD